jgi:Na+-transporting NADH:ubiquinone oxidoreductase subunit NqrE
MGIVNHASVKAISTNNTIIDTSESLGVRSYIFIPCVVYGKGEGFGNQISIQTVAIVKAARALRQVYRTDVGNPVRYFPLRILK